MIHFMRITYRRRRALMLATSTLAPETKNLEAFTHRHPVPLAITPANVTRIVKAPGDRHKKAARIEFKTKRARLLSP